jgi:hypothetical protein
MKMILYCDGTNWGVEFSHIGAAFYETLDGCVTSHECALTECGVVEIEVTGGPLTGKKQHPKTGAWYYHIGRQGDENEDVTLRFVRWAMEPKASWLLDSEGRPAQYGTEANGCVGRDDLVILRPGDEGFDEALERLQEELDQQRETPPRRTRKRRTTRHSRGRTEPSRPL